jgi:hypothetical protein
MPQTSPQVARLQTRPQARVSHASVQIQTPIAGPVHRWLRFPDSWDVPTVQRAFDLIGVRRSDVIYDPFVGCGTTPVAAAARGMRTVSMDRSALSVLATVVKLYPPDPGMLDSVAEKLRSCPCNIMIRKLQVRRLRRGAASPVQRALVFALVAGWFRARERAPWDATSAMTEEHAEDAEHAIAAPDARWLEESLRVVEEMRADQPPAGSRAIQHVVRCREFSNDVTKLPGLTGQNSIVMVTSPPLPTRHIDLDRQRLDRMIHTTVPRLRIFDRHDHHTESLAAVEMRRVATYERFVESLLAHAQRLQCTAIAVEMSTRLAPQGVPCDELLLQKLPDYGFKLLDVDRSVREATGIPGSASARPREWLTTICAVAIQPPVITDCPSSTHPSDSRSTAPPAP